MAVAESSVFISYSRRDYYFAESLAFHLLERGLPAWMDVKDLKPGGEWERDLEAALATASTMLLVASPHSIASARVRDEWQHALRRGYRIIVVRFRNTALPPELRACEVVDFRGAFGPAFRRLASRLAADAEAGSPERDARSWFPLPPWVAVMAVTCALPVLAYFGGADWTGTQDDEYWAFIPLFQIIAGLGLAWFFCGALLYRRMGMTRLALCLLCLAVVFALPALAHYVPRLSFLATPDIAATFSRFSLLGTLSAAAPMIGLCILVLVKPEDLLRWAPTGKAWAAYRIGHVANAVFGGAELAFQFAQIKSFVLAHDPVDAPMAQRLREQLVALGGAESPANGPNVTPVRLLTNRTRLAWMDSQREDLQAGITVVGTRIGLPPSLDWLWRRQWIDFRRWDLRRSDRAQALPQVPDAVTQSRLPSSVSRGHHVLCAVAAIVFMLGGALSPESQQTDELSGAESLSMLTFMAAVWWGLMAHRLVKRTRPAPLLVRDGLVGCAATVILVGIDFYSLANGKLDVLRMIAAAAFLIAAWGWLSRQQETLAFWLPQEKLTRGARRAVLGAGIRDWNTLIWFMTYALLWRSVSGFA